MTQVDRIQEYLQRLTPLARNNLLTELERLEHCGIEIPGAGAIIEKLRAEFRAAGQPLKRAANPARYFFAPLEPLLVEGAPEHANSGRIQRGSLSAIWEWISRDLLPTMARDYTTRMTDLITADKQREARQAASIFQTKVVKSLENIIGSPDNVAQIRNRLATYTASQAAYDDLAKTLGVLRARDALAKFSDALPARIHKFEDAQVAKVTQLLDAFAKDHPDQVPFALALVAGRLKSSWQLIRLATKAVPSKSAADVAAAPYAIAVSMVLDRLEDKRATLRAALKNERILVSREILADVYDTEYALRVRIELEQSDWGQRLDQLMAAIATLVEAEVSRFPENVGHVLGSRSLRSHESLAGRMTYWAWKGRDAVSEGVAYCKKMVSGPEKSRA
jgi:flagellin-specific chaperone FliS